MANQLIPYVSQKDFFKQWFASQVAPKRIKEIEISINDIVVEAFQAEAVFSHARDPKPVIASYGAGPCVILGGYDPDNKVGFIAHFSHDGEVVQGGLLIAQQLKNLTSDSRGKFDLVLKGGIQDDQNSQKTISAIKRWTGLVQYLFIGLAMTIQSIDTLDSENDKSRSLMIDTRTGSMQDYDPLKQNPFYRKLTVDDITRAKNSYEKEAQLTIAYRPSAEAPQRASTPLTLPLSSQGSN